MNDTTQTNSMSEQAQAAAGQAAQVWESTKEKANEALHTSERYVREHPGTSVLGVFGAGVALGALIGWSLAHQQQDSYADYGHQFLKRLGEKLNL